MRCQRLGMPPAVWLVCIVLGLPCLVTAADRLTVYVVNYPLKYFAERIAGAHATVVLPAPPDVDPAFWMPDTDTIAAYQRADLILLNGAHYAHWLRKVSLPTFRLVDTSSGFQDRYIPIADRVTHTHGPTGEHTHTDVAFTTWLDFDLAARQAKAIADALSRRRPELRETFQRQYAALAQDLMALDQAIKALVATQQQRLIASHPVYDYLARRYSLSIKSVHWEPGVMPDAEQWVALQALRQTHPARWMIWERQPIAIIAAKLKTMGIESLVFDPCANAPAQGNFLSVMRQNVENLKLAFQ